MCIYIYMYVYIYIPPGRECHPKVYRVTNSLGFISGLVRFVQGLCKPYLGFNLGFKGFYHGQNRILLSRRT